MASSLNRCKSQHNTIFMSPEEQLEELEGIEALCKTLMTRTSRMRVQLTKQKSVKAKLSIENKNKIRLQMTKTLSKNKNRIVETV